MTKEQTACCRARSVRACQREFLLKLESVDKRLADYAQERFEHGVTMEKVKGDFRRCAELSGRK